MIKGNREEGRKRDEGKGRERKGRIWNGIRGKKDMKGTGKTRWNRRDEGNGEDGRPEKIKKKRRKKKDKKGKS